MRRFSTLLGLCAAFASPGCAAPPSASAQPAVASTCSVAPRQGRVLAHPIVRGIAGPFTDAAVVLDRPADPPGLPFNGRMIAQGACFTLEGPDEPSDFFLFDVRAVAFVPLDRGRSNGIVILANRDRIGPGHGTDRVVYAYRVTATGAERAPDLETRLEGLGTVAAVRRALAGAEATGGR